MSQNSNKRQKKDRKKGSKINVCQTNVASNSNKKFDVKKGEEKPQSGKYKTYIKIIDSGKKYTVNVWVYFARYIYPNTLGRYV